MSEITPGYTRVTQVLSPFSNLSHIDKDVLEKAADRGTRVHKFCTMYANNLLVVDPDEDCKNYVESFIKWFDETVESVIFTEKRIEHVGYKLSGELDMVCMLKGDTTPTLLDIKTPANKNQTWQLQTAAYKMLLREVCGYQVDRRISLMIPKEGGSAKVVEYTNHALDEAMYLDALRLYRFFNV